MGLIKDNTTKNHHIIDLASLGNQININIEMDGKARTKDIKNIIDIQNSHEISLAQKVLDHLKKIDESATLELKSSKINILPVVKNEKEVATQNNFFEKSSLTAILVNVFFLSVVLRLNHNFIYNRIFAIIPEEYRAHLIDLRANWLEENSGKFRVTIVNLLTLKYLLDLILSYVHKAIADKVSPLYKPRL
ncbi:hypothetical protein [Nostoc cycadae]|uniref:Uncharacterized protein n=1 Tax=Nostoc cycadae WK-1 TaxID=1861711 RepID=A0A2H6LQX7_9NOSO|nr:hypothetical protein [Nostoc cycadae]GBE95627.1 hypothetical protein NCWK1_5415 [Nostoc cycadae WK-1]